MSERRYRITAEVDAPDNMDEGTLHVLAGIVAAALYDADLDPVRLDVEVIA